MVRNGFLLLGTVVLFLLAGEGVLRLGVHELVPGNEWPSPQALFCRPDPILGWAGRENASGSYIFEEPDMEDMKIRMNAEGFWDRQHRRKNPSKTRRILFLGDSFTAGYGIPMEKRFSSLVDERMPETCEVINMGLWGYSLGQELLLLQQKGLEYDPDLVVLPLFMDDLFCAHLYSVNEGRYLKPKYRIQEAGDLRLENENIPSNRTWSLFWNFLISRYYELRNRVEVGGEYHRLGWLSVMDRSYAERKMFTLPLLLLSRVHDICRSRGIDFLLVSIPDVEQLSANELKASGRSFNGIPIERLDLLLPQKVLRAFCGKSGILFLDLLPVLTEHPNPRSLYFKHDLHWTREGHELAADAIAARVGGSSSRYIGKREFFSPSFPNEEKGFSQTVPCERVQEAGAGNEDLVP